MKFNGWNPGPGRVSLYEFTGSEAECETIVEWRNAASYAFPDQEPWTVPGQIDWYDTVYLTDPSLNLYWVCLDNRPIGTVGMRIKNGFEMMWMVLGDTQHARNGYMRQGMRMLMEAYGKGHYWGRVMPGNGGGLRFQVDNGFKITGAKDGLVIIELDFDGTWPE